MKIGANISKNSWKRYLLWTVLSLMVLSIGVATVWETKDKPSGKVVVDFRDDDNVDNMVSKEELLGIFHKIYPKGIEGVPQNVVDIAAIEKQISENPFIDSTTVYFDGRNTLHIDVAERIPVMRILSKVGENYYVDKAANNIPRSKGHAARVLVATGHIPKYAKKSFFEDQHVLNDLLQIGLAIKSSEFASAYIESIYVDHKGVYRLQPKVGDFEILTTRSENIENRLENLRVFLKEGISLLGWQTYKYLDIDGETVVIAKRKENKRT